MTRGLATDRAAATDTPRRGALTVRLLFGVAWAIDATLKWLPGYRHTYLAQLQATAQGQPSWLHWWVHFWITLQSHAPSLFATLTGPHRADQRRSRMRLSASRPATL